MTPHDLTGQPFCRGDIVACPYAENKICLGVVSEVNYETGAVVVRSVVLTRITVIEEIRFLFPANQVVILQASSIRPDIPEHSIILKEHQRLK